MLIAKKFFFFIFFMVFCYEKDSFAVNCQTFDCSGEQYGSESTISSICAEGFTKKICYGSPIQGQGAKYQIQSCDKCPSGQKQTKKELISTLDCTVTYYICEDDEEGGGGDPEPPIEMCPLECPSEFEWSASKEDPLKELICVRAGSKAYCEERCKSGVAYEVEKSGITQLGTVYCKECPANAVCSGSSVKCNSGFYITTMNYGGYKGIAFCNKCPPFGEVSASTSQNANDISDCYIQQDISLEDDTGYFKFQGIDCHYTKQ